MDAKELRELQRLVSLYCDGGLEQSDLARLSGLLADNPEAAEAYLELTTVHSDLILLGTSATPGSRGILADDSANDLGADKLGGSAERTGGEAKGKDRSWLRLGLVGLAASLLTMVVYQGMFAPTGTVDSAAKVSDDAGVAQIIRKVDCDWEDDRWAVVSSSGVDAGQTISLSRGLMELKFNSGALVTLEAPVTFTVESEMRGVLSHGKLTADVPKSAHGFTVSTPGGEAIDLGTNFGLFVGDDGVTETHVFKGEVVVRPVGAENDDQALHLTDDMALRTGGKENQSDSLVAVPERFIRFDFDEGESQHVPAVDRQLALWLSADQHLQKDENDRVSSWGDLCTVSNTTAENAWQMEVTKRPKWIENAIGGRPAVRFNVKNVLVTEPIKLGSAQSICAAFSINETLLKKMGVGEIGRQLVNLNGPPHMILGIDDKLKLVSRNYAGLRKDEDGKKGHRTVGMMKSPEKLDEKPVVVISVYDPATNHSRLYMNGVLVARNTAPLLDATESPRYIGAHSILPNSHFFGDVAELMIYDTGLTEEEALTLSKSMMEKYSIAAPVPVAE